MRSNFPGNFVFSHDVETANATSWHADQSGILYKRNDCSVRNVRKLLSIVTVAGA